MRRTRRKSKSCQTRFHFHLITFKFIKRWRSVINGFVRPLKGLSFLRFIKLTDRQSMNEIYQFSLSIFPINGNYEVKLSPQQPRRQKVKIIYARQEVSVRWVSLVLHHQETWRRNGCVCGINCFRALDINTKPINYSSASCNYCDRCCIRV